MKVIMLDNVRGIGQKNEVKEVKEGYARNFLIARGLAKPATPDAIAKIELDKKGKAEKDEMRRNLIRKIFSEIDGKEILIKANVNDKGHLYAQIHEDTILRAIKDSLKVDFDKHWIAKMPTIKSVGSYDIDLNSDKSKAKIALVVVAE
jgi:large subunit ribosomal protein L9